jgi:Cd2+/Zn2+-exporting ATPase
MCPAILPDLALGADASFFSQTFASNAITLIHPTQSLDTQKVFRIITISYYINNYMYNHMSELREKLQKIGFTEYESKVYIALLKENPATGYQISKASSVPRSMVYEVLSRLHARGAVMETIEGRATYYQPLPPEILLDQHQASLEELISDLRPALSQLYSSTDNDRVWSITDESAIYAYCDQMLNKVEKEAYLVLDDRSLKKLAPILEELANNNIELNLLLTGEKTIPFGNTIQHPPLESELQGLTQTLLILIDDSELLVADISKDSLATITSNSNLLLIARQFVWMEFFTQRIYNQIGPELIGKLSAEDRKIFESLT